MFRLWKANAAEKLGAVSEPLEALVNAVFTSRSPYRWDFNIMYIPIFVIFLKMSSNFKVGEID